MKIFLILLQKKTIPNIKFALNLFYSDEYNRAILNGQNHRTRNL